MSSGADSAAQSPLRDGDTGAFGVLLARPNPEGLVVRHVLSFERMIPRLEYDAGRRLTPEELERERLRSPAIAVTPARDRAMSETEAATRRQTIDNHQ